MMTAIYKVPTTVVSGFICIGKQTLANMHRHFVRNLDSAEYHWIEKDGKRILNPEWPNNYIETIKVLDKSGIYRAVLVSGHEEIRKEMANAGIKYTNIYPENSQDIKSEIMKRISKKGYSSDFIHNIDGNFGSFVDSMANDPNASMKIPLTMKTLTEWGVWCILG